VIGGDAGKLPGGVAALKDWLEEGFPLGNRTFSRRHLSAVSAQDYIADIQANDRFLASFESTPPLIQKRRVFRYPYLEEGNTVAKREAVRNYLRDHGYRIAEVTIDYQDWAWDEAYLRCAGQHNTNAMQWLRLHLVDAARRDLRFAQKLSQLTFGREIRHILLLHLCTINAVALEDVLRALRADGVKFISLDDTLSDPVYQIDPRIADFWGRSFPVRMADARHLAYPYDENVYSDRLLHEVCRSGG
jgi:peptidoglycan/xylan/chitin deacetylase (PgdA/CDA1 family)